MRSFLKNVTISLSNNLGSQCAEYRLDLTELAQQATRQEIEKLLGVLVRCNSQIITTLREELHALLQRGIFDSDVRPRTCVTTGFLIFSNPYQKRATGEWAHQSARDVEELFQDVLNLAMYYADFSFQVLLSVAEPVVVASTVPQWA